MKTKLSRSPVSLYKLARSVLLGLVILTVLNCILYLLGSETYYVDSVLLAWSLFSVMDDLGVFMGLIVPVLILGAYVAAYILSKRKGAWMIVALVLFALDTLFLLYVLYLAADYYGFGIALLSNILSILVHAAILVLLILAVKHRKAGTMTDEEIARANTTAGDLTARVEGNGAAPLVPEVDCGVIVKAAQQKLATPSQGLVRFEDQQLVIAGQGMAASMLVGSLLAPMNELARVGYFEIAGLLFTNPKKTQMNLFLPDGRVAMLSFTKANRDRFYQLMLQHGVSMPLE